ncbi:hypothetical protein POM88_001141 [Heracleum sosnowskyi]|uniref:Uncharacterized protein n=1 Tax=Heracleum sosnowskyi TaxID=360622 RepID=A0AAD8NAG7_9APIA|nr:hypothetical protein POM88_001141 [Heracleum sosnowskyi]
MAGEREKRDFGGDSPGGMVFRWVGPNRDVPLRHVQVGATCIKKRRSRRRITKGRLPPWNCLGEILMGEEEMVRVDHTNHIKIRGKALQLMKYSRRTTTIL